MTLVDACVSWWVKLLFLVLLGNVVLFLPQSLHRLLAPPDLVLLTLWHERLLPLSKLFCSQHHRTYCQTDSLPAHVSPLDSVTLIAMRLDFPSQRICFFNNNKNHKTAHFYSCAFVSFSHSRQKNIASVIIANYALDVNRSSLMKWGSYQGFYTSHLLAVFLYNFA